MFNKLRETHGKVAAKPFLDKLGLAVDLGMIGLVISNLVLIVFDWLFSANIVASALADYTPTFHDFYDGTIHQNFITYDLIFVSIYLVEFFIRWFVAVVRKTHHRWFFYPFLHWYDILGCIPVGSFRWLRVLRIVTLLNRLQRLEIIDLSNTYLGKTAIKYYRILVEEISDRVVINVLQGAQREVADGSPLIKRVDEKIIQPRKQFLADYITDQLIQAGDRTYKTYHKELSEYLASLVDRSIADTRHGRRIVSIPIAGARFRVRVSETVSDLTDTLLTQILADLQNPEHKEFISFLLLDLVEKIAPDGQDLNQLIQQSVHEILDEVIIQVGVKRWRLEADVQLEDEVKRAEAALRKK